MIAILILAAIQAPAPPSAAPPPTPAGYAFDCDVVGPRKRIVTLSGSSRELWDPGLRKRQFVLTVANGSLPFPALTNEPATLYAFALSAARRVGQTEFSYNLRLPEPYLGRNGLITIFEKHDDGDNRYGRFIASGVCRMSGVSSR